MLISQNILKDKRYSFAKIGLVCAVMIFIIMLPSMIQNHGIFIIRGDYVDQHLTRLIRAKENFASGAATWDWYNFLGAPYNALLELFSINSICLLFPKNLIPYAVTYMHLMRFALIGIASFAYLRYMVKEEKHAFLGAILYTFSSYMFINLEFMQFIEALWTFPLLLLAVEKMFRSEKYRHGLILATLIASIVDFYLFFFSALSFTLYFICRFFFSEEWREKRKFKFLLLAITECLLGFLCALIVVLPYIYDMFNSSGSFDYAGSSFSVDRLFNGYFSRVFSLFTPAASNRFSTFGFSQWFSRATYVPVFGLSFVIAMFFNKSQKNRRWVNILSIMSVICILFPWASLIYNMFSFTYTRFSYAMVLFFVVASVVFLDNYDEKVSRKGIRLTIILSVLLFAVYGALYLFIAPKSAMLGIMVYVFNPAEEGMRNFLILYTAIATIFMLAFLFAYLKSQKVRNHIIPIIMVAVTLYGCSYTLINLKDEHLLDYYPESTISLKEQVDKYFIDIPEFEQAKDYRIDHSRQLRNYAYATTIPSISVFESNKNIFSSEIAKELALHSDKVTIFPEDPENELRTLLGVKYYYDLYPADNLPVPEGFTYLRTDNGIDVYENDNFIGLGFSYDNYITRSEYEAMKIEGSSASLMLNTLVVEDEDEKFVSDILKKYENGYICGDRISVDSFETSSSGFSATITTDEAKIIFVPVAYENNGWTAEINGEEAEFIKANIGCIAFRVEAGENNVAFRYKSPSFNLGLIGSCVGIAATALYILAYQLIKRKKSAIII